MMDKLKSIGCSMRELTDEIASDLMEQRINGGKDAMRALKETLRVIKERGVTITYDYMDALLDGFIEGTNDIHR